MAGLATACGVSAPAVYMKGIALPNEFALDVARIRADAREKMAQGAVTRDNTSPTCAPLSTS
jgi:hypothetical protein